MPRLKLSLFDKIFRKDRYKKIIYPRNQIDFMLYEFEKIPVLTRYSYYNSKMLLLVGNTFFQFDEVRMFNELGEKSVITRLTSDRDMIFNTLRDVKEIDISKVLSDIREEKINNIIN